MEHIVYQGMLRAEVIHIGKELKLIGLECLGRLVEFSLEVIVSMKAHEARLLTWSELVHGTLAAVGRVDMRGLRLEAGRPVRGHDCNLDER